LLRLSAALAALGLALPVAEQEAYAQVPKTIRFIVPFPAGGGADLLVRVLSEQIGRSAGAATVVENRPAPPRSSARNSSRAPRPTAARC